MVVDNGSADNSVEMVRSRFPDAGVVALEANAGFGAALNRAIAERGEGDILLLNNDVVCEPDFVAEMAAAQGTAEMVAGLLTLDAAPGTIDSAGIVADRRTLMAFDYLHGRPADEARGAAPPLGPTGGAALYARDAFEAAGGFDERIFAYYEDLDLALRLRVRGARCALARGARARHTYSATLRDRIGDKYALTGWGRGYLLRRYGVAAGPAGLGRVAACELPICAGQVILDRTLKGVGGRVRGWRAGAGLERRPLPADGLLELSVRRSLRLRIAGFGRSRRGGEPDV